MLIDGSIVSRLAAFPGLSSVIAPATEREIHVVASRGTSSPG